MSFESAMLVFLFAVLAYVAYKHKAEILAEVQKLRTEFATIPAAPAPVASPAPAPVIDHPAIISTALQGAAAVVAASQPAAPAKPAITELSQVVDQATLDQYRAYLATTNPSRLAYVTPTYVPPSSFQGFSPVPPAAEANPNGVFPPLVKGLRMLVNPAAFGALVFPVPADAVQVVIAETSSGSDATTYNLWGSSDVAGLTVTAGSAGNTFQYNAAVLNIPAGSGTAYAQVRQGIALSPFYIQAN